MKFLMQSMGLESEVLPSGTQKERQKIFKLVVNWQMLGSVEQGCQKKFVIPSIFHWDRQLC